jgi:hypothetical protein
MGRILIGGKKNRLFKEFLEDSLLLASLETFGTCENRKREWQASLSLKPSLALKGKLREGMLALQKICESIVYLRLAIFREAENSPAWI